MSKPGMRMQLVTNLGPYGVHEHTSATTHADPGHGLAGWLLAWLPRLRASLAAGETQRARKQLRLIETLAIGGRRQLMLVSCDGERFLVGSGPDSIQTIVPVHSQAARPAAPQPLEKGPAEPWA